MLFKRVTTVALIAVLLPLILAAKPLRIGVFTGTMDPPHKQHVQMVIDALEQLDLDVIFFSPNFTPPHKPEARPFALRSELSKLAFRNIEGAEFFDDELLEIFKNKGIDSVLKALKKRDSENEIYQIMGSDSILRYGDNLAAAKLDFVTLAVCSRVGEEIVFESLPESFQKKIIMLPSAPKDFSSTAVREKLKKGKPSKMLSKAVNEAVLKSEAYLESDCTDGLIGKSSNK